MTITMDAAAASAAVVVKRRSSFKDIDDDADEDSNVEKEERICLSRLENGQAHKSKYEAISRRESDALTAITDDDDSSFWGSHKSVLEQEGDEEQHQLKQDDLSDSDSLCKEPFDSSSRWWTTTPQHISPSFGGYVQSGRFQELVACLVFFIVGHILFDSSIEPFNTFWVTRVMNYRPMPLQHVPSTTTTTTASTSYTNTSADYIILDSSHNELYQGETVPGGLHKKLLLLPLIIQLLLSLGVAQCRRRGDVHNTMCVYWIAMSWNEMITKALKVYVGYLRPVFWALCQPNVDFTECQSMSDKIRKSFPSSHSSTSLTVATLLALYIYTRFGMHSQVRYLPATTTTMTTTDGSPSLSSSTTSFVKVYEATSSSSSLWPKIISMLSLLPVLFALFIACSRIVDNMHFPADVIAGCLIGYASAKFSHSLWFV